MTKNITYKAFGPCAILIEWEPKIDEVILQDIIQFKDKISAVEQDLLQDCIVGYHSLTIVYKESLLNFSKKKAFLKTLYTQNNDDTFNIKYQWEIPVCYDLQFGFDLATVAKHTGYSNQQVIDIHTQNIYTVYFIGFLPGFLYLGGLDPTLHIPRKETPNLHKPKGSVAIGGSQTGVYPQDSPGGWHVIGQTPISFFTPKNTSPCFAKTGDKIQFTPINEKEFSILQNDIKNGNHKLFKKLIHD